MRQELYPNSVPDRTPITTAVDRVQRLEKLYGDLVGRYGSQHPLARRVAQQLGHAKVAGHLGEEAGL